MRRGPSLPGLQQGMRSHGAAARSGRRETGSGDQPLNQPPCPVTLGYPTARVEAGEHDMSGDAKPVITGIH